MSKRSEAKRAAKRKEKSRDLRRLSHASPLELLAGLHTIECYWSNPSGDERLIDIAVLRPDRQGRWHLAGALVDRDCVGLKDAYLSFDVQRSRVIKRITDRDLPLVRADAALVRPLIAAAIRWSREHAFRLPEETQKLVTLLGGVGPTAAADVTGFGGPDGKLLYVGQIEDLQDLLIDTTVAEFSQRQDVSFIVEGPAQPSEYLWAPGLPFDDVDLGDDEMSSLPPLGPGTRLSHREKIYDLINRMEIEAEESGERLSRYLPRAIAIGLVAIASLIVERSAINPASLRELADEIVARMTDEMFDVIKNDTDVWPNADVHSLTKGLTQVLKYMVRNSLPRPANIGLSTVADAAPVAAADSMPAP